MDPNAQAAPQDLEGFRGYLACLARSHLDPRLRSKLDPEDVVQATLVKAHQGFGPEVHNVKAWLRTILLRTLFDEVVKLPKDEVRDHSSFRLGSQIADDATPPAEKAQKNEEAIRLEDALGRLPERQREAVELRYFHGWRVKEICAHMHLSLTAVAGLLKRGMDSLRTQMKETE